MTKPVISRLDQDFSFSRESVEIHHPTLLAVAVVALCTIKILMDRTNVNAGASAHKGWSSKLLLKG